MSLDRTMSLVIAGAGPAGLTAAIYAARSRVPTLVIEGLSPGGSMLYSEEIHNYPGFPQGIPGMELSDRMRQQADRFGAEFLSGYVSGVAVSGGERAVVLEDGQRIGFRALIVATGSSRRKLGVSGEERLAGKGVSYCALCDGPLFRGKRVAVVGGGNSALEEAMYLARFVSECYLVHRREAFRAAGILQEELLRSPVKPVVPCVVERIEGNDRVEAILLKNRATDETRRLLVDGVFISVGQRPNTAFLVGRAQMNEGGYLIVDENMQTSLPGVFACGDAVRKKLYQVVTACGEGAVAAVAAEEYLKRTAEA